ncbi:MAG: type I 3-dehydroquinate dehydratase [Wujia sp.]
MNKIIIKNKEIGACRPKVCVPLVGRTDKEITEQVIRIVQLAEKTTIDIVEFRGDFYENLDDFDKLSALMKNIYEMLGDIILLFTIRSEREGGQVLGFEAPSIKEINSYVITNQLADIIDVELFSGEEAIALVELAKKTKVKVIMSNHDFNTTPDVDTMVKRLCKMQDMGADIAKIAVMPENKQHVLDLLSAVVAMNRKYARVPIVGISMGGMGAISRISGELFGSAITFAALETASAPGQIPVEDINNILSSMEKYCSK